MWKKGRYIEGQKRNKFSMPEKAKQREKKVVQRGNGVSQK